MTAMNSMKKTKKNSTAAPAAPPGTEQTMRWLLIAVGVLLVFAVGRWSVTREPGPSPVAPVAPTPGPLSPPPQTTRTDPSGLKSGIALTIAGRPSLGSAAAPITFIEFSDFQCPFCGRYVRDTLPKILAAYVDTGKIHYVFRHYPIAELHPQAPMSARAADCAHQQGRFWPMHDRLFASPTDHSQGPLTALASASGLNMSSFAACMSAGARPLLREDYDAGTAGGMAGTPAFFMGPVTQGGTVQVTHTVYGAQPYEAFATVIDAALRTAGPAVR
jgi:protein-disulfide isomerase